MAPIVDIVTIHRALKDEWRQLEPNMTMCGELLSAFMIEITKYDRFLSIDVDVAEFQEDFLIARDMFEVGVLWSIAVDNITYFERYMIQLKSSYQNYKDILPESRKQYYFLSLNLMFLLSRNRIAEFHLELETLEPDFRLTSSHILYVVNLEMHLMVGSYNEVFKMLNHRVTRTFHYFAKILKNTVRGEICECMKKSYEKVSLDFVRQRLQFTNIADTIDFCTKQNMVLGDDSYYHFNSEEKMETINEPSQALNVASNAINYCKVLDTIV